MNKVFWLQSFTVLLICEQQHRRVYTVAAAEQQILSVFVDHCVPLHPLPHYRMHAP